jgi:hypothetical protein
MILRPTRAVANRAKVLGSGRAADPPPNSISGMLNDPSGCAAPKWLAPLHGGRHEFAPDSSLEGPGFETSVPPATVSSVVALVARLAARDRAPKRTPRFSRFLLQFEGRFRTLVGRRADQVMVSSSGFAFSR